MTTLITGSGLIGAQISKQFLDSGEKVILYDIAPQVQAINEIVSGSNVVVSRGDILDLANLLSVIKENRVERIVHTAALLPGGLGKNLYGGIRVNTDGTLNVLEASRLADLKRVVYISTLGVYAKEGRPEDPVDEEQSTFKPVSLYGATKLMSEYAGTSYSKTYGIDFKIVRLANVIGPWSGPIQTNTGGFIKQLLVGALFGKGVEIPNPNPMILEAEWVYSKDVATAVFKLMRKVSPRYSTYNVGTGKLSKASEIVDAIKEQIPQTRIVLGPGTPMPARPLKIDRSKEDLGWMPEYDIRTMIHDMISWYKSKKQD